MLLENFNVQKDCFFISSLRLTEVSHVNNQYGHVYWTRHPKRVETFIRFSMFHFIHFAISQPNRKVQSCIRVHLKANLVLYQSYEYELSNILNKDKVHNRIQHIEGGGGGRWYTHSLWEKRVARVKVD